MTIYLEETDVAALLEPQMAMSAIEEAFRRLNAGTIANSLHHRVPLAAGSLSALLAADSSDGLSAAKVYSTGRQLVTSGGGADGYDLPMLLFRDQKVLAVMQSNGLTQAKIAATSALAARLLAREGAASLGIIGCGYQAPAQVAYVRDALPAITRVVAHCRTPARLEEFCRRVGAEPGTAAEAAGQDVVITITNSMEPLIAGGWLRPGAFVIVTDANRDHLRTLDDVAIERAALLVASTVADARNAAGDFAIPVARGLVSWDDVVDLGAITTGAHPGRGAVDDIVIFKSISLAAESLMLAKAVYDRALSRTATGPEDTPG